MNAKRSNAIPRRAMSYDHKNSYGHHNFDDASVALLSLLICYCHMNIILNMILLYFA